MKRSWRKGQRKVKNGSRAASFCRWLLAVYGEELLASGSGVVDVAGGRGELAFQLHCLRNIPTTVIDPRPLKLHTNLSRIDKGAHLRATPLHESKTKTAQDTNIFIKSSASTPSSLSITASSDEKKTPLTPLTPLSSQSSTPSIPKLPNSIQACFPAPVGIDGKISRFYNHYLKDSAKYQPDLSAEVLNELDQVLNSFSVLVGLHPDQATEPIVDWALLHNKPFAVVPCCVFPNMFPLRGRDVKIPLSEAVSKHGGFVEYLMQKDPRIRSTQLDFEGRNVVVYLDPSISVIDTETI